jgi:uncharacterized membrane protein YheB (UPF0754 family)
MKHSKASSRKDADSISSALATHKDKSSIKKNAAQRKVHAAIADGLDKTLKTNRKLKDEQITLPLSSLSEATLCWEEELDEIQQTNKAYERLLWEGRYCDYISEILKKVKSSKAWQRSNFKDWMWREVHESYSIRGQTSDKIDAVIRMTASELSVPSQAIRVWILLYAGRNGNKAHHSGLANLIARKDTRGVVEKLIDDKKSIYDATPESLQESISSVLLAIDKYQNDLFEVCKVNNYQVTETGKKKGLVNK